MNAKFAIFLALAASLLPGAALAQVTWNIQYLDGSGSGFNDTGLGTQRKQALEDVAAYVGSVLNYTGTVDLRVEISDSDEESNTLASAGPLAFQSGGFAGGLVWSHVTTGSDPSSGNPDATLTVNFGHNYNLGTGPPDVGQFDLRSVLLHELTHTLGVLTFALADGSSRIYNNDGPDAYSTFDSYLFLGTGTAVPGVQLFPGAQFSSGLDSSALISDNIWFYGPEAMAANGGLPVKVYAPNDPDDPEDPNDPVGFLPGSSLGHFEPGVDSVMVPGIAPETVRRTYTDLDLAVLRDLNWSVVPEPGAAALLLIGALVALRRRVA